MNKNQDHSRLYWILGFLIYIFYLVGHIPVSEFCYYIRDTYSAEVYKYYILLMGKVLLAMLIIWLIWKLTNSRYRIQKAGLWLVFLVGVGYFYQDLIVFDIEYVHFIQYCCFTIVLYHAFKQRYTSAILLSLCLGFLDEVYQAYHPTVPLNWRDVLLNVLGVVAGGLVLYTLDKNDHAAVCNSGRVD